MKSIFYLLSLLISLGLCSCVYEAPLVEEATESLDASLSGTWQKILLEGEDESDSGETLSILPFSKTEYVVINKPGGNGAMICLPGTDNVVFRAYPIKTKGLSLIQIEWLQPYLKGGSRFHVCRYTIENGLLTVETLNRDIVRPEITDSSELREMVLSNQDNPELFSERFQYRRIEQ